MRLLYTLTVIVYGMMIRLASVFNAKARLWVKGRKNYQNILREKFSDDRPTAWFHCASLGEFEQGRPLLEVFREKHPEYRILLTFFSPSGYEIRKNYPKADVICYLPLDTPYQVKRFINLTKPALVFFIKYEYWYNFIFQLFNRNIPVYIVSGIFRKEQHFFRWYGNWFRKQLKKIQYFFLQNQESLELLHSIGIHHCAVSGDTRFDRVSAIATTPSAFPLIEKWREGKKLLLAGSTWPEDEILLFNLIEKTTEEVVYIIAPHEVHESRVVELLEKAGKAALRFTQLPGNLVSGTRIIIVDTMGQLSSLYQYAHIAYIGGGFGKGIHNILEAATFGLPVFFGPNYYKFQEARELVLLKGAFSIASTDELLNEMTLLLDHQERITVAGNICRQYVNQNTGATQLIMNHLDEKK